MCGLFGVMSKYPLTRAEKEQFKTLGLLSTLRGEDSSGIILGAKDEEKNCMMIYNHKSVEAPYNYLFQNKEVEELLNTPKIRFIMGHSRAATLGDVNLQNAQPISYKKIYGMHNGTIHDFIPRKKVVKDKITTWDKDTTKSDSHHLFRRIHDEGLEPTLLDVGFSGAYALTYFDFRDSCIVIVRNDKRPLSFMHDRQKSLYFWASDSKFLRFIKSFNQGYSDPVSLEPHLLHKIKPDSLTIETTPEFAKIKPVYTYTKGKSFDWGDGVLPFGEEFGGCKRTVHPPKKNHKNNKTQVQDRQNAFKMKRESFYRDIENMIKKDTKTEDKDDPVVFMYKYRGFRSKVMFISDADKILEHGCVLCQVQKDTNDYVWWVDHNDFVCPDCVDNELVKSCYQEYYEGVIFKEEAS